MELTQRNKYLAIGGGVVVVFALAWLILSQIAGGRAEETLQDLVDDFGMRDDVSWNSVSSSPLGGTITIKDVRLRMGGKEELQLARVEIRDFTDDQRRKRADVRIINLAGMSDVSPFGELDFVRAAGRSDLPPATLAVSWDADLDDDEVRFHLAIDQPAALKATVELELERVAGLTRLAQGGPSREGRGLGGGRGGDPFAGGLAAALGMLESAGEVRIRRAEIELRDDGYIKRSVALHKRYNGAIVAADGQADRQRDAWFKRNMEQALDDCRRDFPVGSGAERRKNCETIIGFVSGENSRISLKVQPDRPVAVGDLMQAVMQDPMRLLSLLRPEIGS